MAQNRACDFNFGREVYNTLPLHTFDLLTRMLEKDPSRRISADTALNHPYFTGLMEAETGATPGLLKSLSNRSLLKYKKEPFECLTPLILTNKKENVNWGLF